MKKITLASFCLFLFVLISCSNNDTNETIDKTVTDDINYFIWKGMNAYYFWQENIPTLADDRFSTFEELYTYFKKFSSPEASFNSLLNQPGTIDRFSWIVNDYVALENSFQGINISNGMEFGLVRNKEVTTNIFGYVRYVIPNSDAAQKGVTRGMIFNAINGTQLTDTNYTSLLFGSNTNYTVNFADYNNGNPTANSQSISLTKSQIQENPVAISKVITEGNKKIGYLLYNQFASSYDAKLNAAFGNFKAENISDLIIDLRYNGGGSVNSATYLGAMVTGQFTGQLYSKEIWNKKILAAVSADNFINNFTNEIRNTDQNETVILQETINSLGLTSVYFIVSGSSASASELVINALSAYIDVQLVGTKTVGKQVGSVTLYDSDNLSRNGDNLNPNHTYAIQPITFEITNKDNKNHPEGFIPGSTLPGILIAEDFGNLGILGEITEPLLNRTLTYISTGAKGSFFNKNIDEYKEFFNSKLATPATNNMYVGIK